MNEILDITPARILRLIRDEKAESLDALRTILGLEGLHPTDAARIERDIQRFLENFKASGLIRWKGDRITPTDLIEAVQKALDISLTDLSVLPYFGKPKRLRNAFEVFVAMPFSQNLQPVYDDHIRKVLNQLGLSVGRADDFFTPGSIISDIWNAIYSGKLVIADCTHRNPNVFYEIGIAHAIGKPVILLAQTLEDVPFDLLQIRTIVYSYSPRGMKEFEGSLKKTIQTVLTQTP